MRRLLAVGLLGCGCYGADAGYGGGDCKAYVTCYEATGGTRGSLDSTYGTMGTCWTTTSQAADNCLRVCKEQLAAVAMAHPDAGCAVK